MMFLLLLFCVGKLAVDCLQALVGNFEIGDLAFEGEARRAIFNAFLHLCDHYPQFFDLLF